MKSMSDNTGKRFSQVLDQTSFTVFLKLCIDVSLERAQKHMASRTFIRISNQVFKIDQQWFEPHREKKLKEYLNVGCLVPLFVRLIMLPIAHLVWINKQQRTCLQREIVSAHAILSIFYCQISGVWIHLVDCKGAFKVIQTMMFILAAQSFSFWG